MYDKYNPLKIKIQIILHFFFQKKTPQHLITEVFIGIKFPYLLASLVGLRCEYNSLTFHYH